MVHQIALENDIHREIQYNIICSDFAGKKVFLHLRQLLSSNMIYRWRLLDYNIIEDYNFIEANWSEEIDMVIIA